ncbi:MAG: hypothetical protein ACRDH5_13460, partial [bacterium]
SEGGPVMVTSYVIGLEYMDADGTTHARWAVDKRSSRLMHRALAETLLEWVKTVYAKAAGWT